VPVRALITSNATQGSGGINTAAYSRDSGGGGLAGRATTLVEGVAAEAVVAAPAAAVAAPAMAPGGTAVAARAWPGRHAAKGQQRQGQPVHRRDQAGLRTQQGRDLRALQPRPARRPALQGKVVLELKIAPSGQVEGLRIVSSELKAEELEKKLLARIRQFDFGAKDVDLMVVTWPVDFLPS
jgi:protein TonB